MDFNWRQLIYWTFLFIFRQLDGATYYSKVQSTGGGVGRNIAEGLSKLHGSVQLISRIGLDQVTIRLKWLGRCESQFSPKLWLCNMHGTQATQSDNTLWFFVIVVSSSSKAPEFQSLKWCFHLFIYVYACWSDDGWDIEWRLFGKFAAKAMPTRDRTWQRTRDGQLCGCVRHQRWLQAIVGQYGYPSGDYVGNGRSNGHVVSVVHFSQAQKWLTALLTFTQIIKNEALISTAPVVLFDGNISVDAMGTILEMCKKYNRPGELVLFISWIFIIDFRYEKQNVVQTKSGK